MDIATALSVSEMGISRRLNGLTPFTAEELIRLSRALNVPVAAFFTPAPALAEEKAS